MSTFSWRRILSVLLLLMCFSYFMTSCVSPKKVVYFNTVPDTIDHKDPYVIKDVTKYEDPVIQSNDMLSITVQTMSQNLTNTPISSSVQGTFNIVNTFLVDKNGMVELSLIGFVKVGGLTTMEARELIKEKAKEYFVEPVVNLKIMNFDIYFLGDIVPRSVTIYHEKINILDAISQAGDLLITGKRKNVLLIRTEGDTKKLVRFDLTNTDLFRSPYFYLRQRDIIYVEPNKFRVVNSDNTFVRNLGIFSSLIGLGTLLLAIRSNNL